MFTVVLSYECITALRNPDFKKSMLLRKLPHIHRFYEAEVPIFK